MRGKEIIEVLEELSPITYAEKWDNVGLLVGNEEKEVGKIMLALDASEGVVEQAVKEKVDMLITHHPIIFRPLKSMNETNFVTRKVVELIKNQILCYAMHTNFDVMGMADAVADEMGLLDRKVLSITYEDEISKEGIGRWGKLPRAISLEEYAKQVKRCFGLDSVRVFGDPEKILESGAISPGAVGDGIVSALEAKVDVLITGDIKHHEGLDGVEQGLAIIDAGHYGLEQIFSPYMKEFLQRELPEIEVVVAFEQSPFWVI